MSRGVHHSKGGAAQTFYVKGSTSSANLTVTGIATDDVLLAVNAMRPHSSTGICASVLNLLSVTTITAANTIQVAAVTTGFCVVVQYEDVDA
jgi:hypothetical protein